jgi:hypothetical protein
MLLRTSFALTLAATCSLATPAFGQEAPATPDKPTGAPVIRLTPGVAPDTVYLKEGGLLRGAIVENVPNDHVTIALPTGDVRRVTWEDVDHVDAAARPAPSAAPPATPKSGPLVKVHIASDESVILDRRPAGMDTWVPACNAPCDEELPLGDEYRVAGAGLRATRPFRLQGEPGGSVEVRLNAKSTTSFGVGAGVGGLGLVIDAYSLYLVFLGSAMMHTSCSSDSYGTAHSCSDSRGAGESLRNVGLVMLIPGTVAAVVGGGMMLANWRSSVSQSTTSSGSAAQASPKPLDAFRRTAEWTAPATPAAGVPFYVPLAAGRF